MKQQPIKSLRPIITVSTKEIRHNEVLDDQRQYLSDAPTPAGMAILLKRIDDGAIGELCEIGEEIEGKDGHLQSVAALRRQAVTALEWSIDPHDTEDEDAVDVAKYVQRQLESIVTWPETLEHLATANGPGVAVTELVWRRGELAETNDVPGARLVSYPHCPSRIGILTSEDMVCGVPASEGKYIIHTPNCRAGQPIRVTLTRPSLYLWTLKHHGVSDWMAFSEVFGMPVKHFQYDPDTITAEEKKYLIANAGLMGPDSRVITSKDVDFLMKESAKGTHPGQEIADWVDRKLSITWLGQTLTTETTGVGSFALGKVHDDIKTSLTVHDVATERRTIGRYVIAPMVRNRFPGQAVPMPFFNRHMVEAVDVESQTLNLDKLRYAREHGLRVDRKVEYEMLGIPMPKESDPADMV